MKVKLSIYASLDISKILLSPMLASLLLTTLEIYVLTYFQKGSEVVLQNKMMITEKRTLSMESKKSTLILMELNY
jgi:hypothetical protein